MTQKIIFIILDTAYNNYNTNYTINTYNTNSTHHT